MQLKRDWDLNFDAEHYVAQVGGNLAALLKRRSVRADWEGALADGNEYVDFCTIWKRCNHRRLRQTAA